MKSCREITLTLISLAVILILFGLLNHVRAKIEDAGMLDVKPDKQLLYLPDWKVMHVLSLNEDLTAADMLWIRGVFYISAQRFEVKQLRLAGVEVEDHWGRHDHKYCQEHFHFDEKDKYKEEERQVPDSVSFFDYDFRQHPVIHQMLFWNIGSADAEHLYRLLDNVTTLDPLFITPYVSGGMNLAIMAGRPGEALLLMNKGLIYNPESWEMLFHRGFIKLFYYNDKIGATEDIKLAATKPGAIPIVISLATSMQAGLKGREFAHEFLRSLSEVSQNEQVRQQVANLLERYK
jgi:hypothetical protein